MTINFKFIGIAVVAVILVVGAWLVVGRNPVAAPEGPADVPTTPGANGDVSPAPPPQSPTGQKPAVAPSPATAAVGISFALPTATDVWALNTQHLIAWNREGDVAGELTLVDESTGKAVGWIVPTTGAEQTSVQWDTRDVAIDRIGGTRKNLAPGTYSLRLIFGGKSEVKSSPFRIVAQGSAETTSQLIRMRDTKLSPTALTVTRGTKVVFVNNETKPQRIQGEKLPPMQVTANGGVTSLDTSSLLPGPYFYITDLYTYKSQGTLTVQ